LTLLNQFGDPHHPLHELVGGPVGNYRPNEMLTTQVLSSMISTINKLGRAPLSNRELDCVVITGDLTDNAQKNEFSWLLRLLESGRVTPNSGGSNYEGPGGSNYSVDYWNPDGNAAGEEVDSPRALYGFPVIPELMPASLQSFDSPGLHIPHIPVHGNHDLLVQGTFPANQKLRELAVGGYRASALGESFSPQAMMGHFGAAGPVSWPHPEIFEHEITTPDERREQIANASWIHDQEEKYFLSELQGIRLIALDTVNEHGGWDGSISTTQLDWLSQQLKSNPSRPVIVLSHHPLESLGNTYAPAGAEPRWGADRIKQLLLASPNVIAWLAGHTHQNKVERIGGEEGFWHIQTCSLIDWPQEGRIIEIFQSEDEYLLVSTMFAHDSIVEATEGGKPHSDLALSRPSDLAGLSRELAANDWQRRSGPASVHSLQGEAADRNVFLSVKRRT
jgi:3',5'-cyclic AMP phosphodiesterase CpdA